MCVYKKYKYCIVLFSQMQRIHQENNIEENIFLNVLDVSKIESGKLDIVRENYKSNAVKYTETGSVILSFNQKNVHNLKEFKRT